MIVPTLSYIPDALLGLIYPCRCKMCGAGLKHPERFFCPDCLRDVRPLAGPFCTVCGSHFPDGAGESHPCYRCIKIPPAFDRARAPVAYDGVVKEAIKLYKYKPVRALKGYLGGFIEEGARKWFGEATLTAAVPLHKRRLRHRGFNQSVFLAEKAAKALGVRFSLDDLVRIRHTRPQVELGPSEREGNVRGAFAALRPEAFKGQRVLLVDDVYTTGATANECARVLKKAGAEAVFVLTVARAVKGG